MPRPLLAARVITAVTAATVVMVIALPRTARAEDLDNEVKDMTYVGFLQQKDASRVYVRTNEPVKYSVDASRPDLVVLVLDNCRVPVYNNTRPLDTQYFDSPITLIEVKPVEGPSPSVRIEIHTRVKTAYKEVQKDTLLALDFTRGQK